MLKQFNVLIKEYSDIANDLAALAERLENPALFNSFKRQSEKIKNTEFHVVVIGQFKRGKSTLINYFLGSDILPTGVIPITSIITRIRYALSPKAAIHYKDHRSMATDIRQIDEYISEQKNPKNVKDIDIIEIYYPSDILKNGVVLIDTPGIGSIHKHNTDEAYRYLPEADAAIFLTSSDAPVGELEMKFLQDAKEYFHKIFFLQNKIDYLSLKEKRESIAFSKEMISKVLESDIKLYPISAKQAYEAKQSGETNRLIESGMKAFEEDMEIFLLKEKGHYLLTSYEEKLYGMIKELEENIDFKTTILNSPVQTLEQQLSLFRGKVKDTATLKKEALALVEADLKEIIEDLEAQIKEFRAVQAEEIKERLESIFDQNKEMNGKDLPKLLSQKLENFVEEAYTDWDKRQIESLKQAYHGIIVRFTGKLNQGIDLVNEITYAVFKLRLAEPIGEFDLIDKDTFYFKFGSSSPAFLGPRLRDFLFLMPKGWRNRIILSDIMKRVDEELEKNGNNLKWDYVSKIKDSKYIFERAYQGHIDDTVANIQGIIQKTMELRSQKKEDIQTQLLYYEQLRDHLSSIKIRMEGLKEA
ncbi:dynamin family protein [Geosporobacter ferrireducens]|uniref:Dynamin N-terminal domain-containing protein n=1 Tax=Geosporobacter ferrireducens TaxID=1424294 RepID=A0A1D8GDK0_9FIRM|nr:dynamin family protein [Geosporobacter ferrireducens]AOT68995.1 hypothetical protein Gferi_05140 [Geosporobacter ferrireducens]